MNQILNFNNVLKTEDLLMFFNYLYMDETKFLTIKKLSLRNGTTLRELSRNVGRSPKSLMKHLKELNDKDIVTCFEASPNIKIYQLNEKYGFLKDLFEKCFPNEKKEQSVYLFKKREKIQFETRTR